MHFLVMVCFRVIYQCYCKTTDIHGVAFLPYEGYGVTNKILTHLSHLAICKLLEIYNHSWSPGTLPLCLKKRLLVVALSSLPAVLGQLWRGL